MTADPGTRRLRPVRPLTVLAEPGQVTLVAGEDLRYALEAPGLEAWLPGLLAGLDGRRELAALLATLDPGLRPAAADLLERLAAERVLVDAPAAERHVPRVGRAAIEGDGPLAERLRRELGTRDGAGPAALRVLVQDRLDWEALARFDRARRAGGAAALWASTGPATRGLVSPLVLPETGPCLGCLVAAFERRSPVPGLYEKLRAHARAGGRIEPSPFPEAGLVVLAGLVLAKLEAAGTGSPDPALYRLHVLDPASLEVRAHPVPADPDCPECPGR